MLQSNLTTNTNAEAPAKTSPIVGPSANAFTSPPAHVISPKDNQEQSLNDWNRFNEQPPSDIESDKTNINNRNKRRPRQRANTNPVATRNTNNSTKATSTRTARELKLLIASSQKKLHQSNPISEGSMGKAPRMGFKLYEMAVVEQIPNFTATLEVLADLDKDF